MSHYQEFLTKKENTQPILFEEVHDSGFSVLVCSENWISSISTSYGPQDKCL